MFRVRWEDWRRLNERERTTLAAESARALGAMGNAESGPTAVTTLLGHKGDLMLVHFRRSFDALQDAQLQVSRLPIAAYLEPTTSYVSIVELGMYEMTAKIHAQIGATHKPGTDEFDRAFDTEMETQRQRVMNRLFLDMPAARYVCFYPMNKRRGEALNWYTEGFDRRASMMREHGMIGRHYAGKVTQVISGSIGFDDWEWGVDLFAHDPLVFKKLIYEMRFDEASAKFAEFGAFYTGLQFAPGQLATYLAGEVPAL